MSAQNRFARLSEEFNDENQGFESNENNRQLNELVKDTVAATVALDTLSPSASPPSTPSESAFGPIKKWVPDWKKRIEGDSQMRRSKSPVSSPSRSRQSSSAARSEGSVGMAKVDRKSDDFNRASSSSAASSRRVIQPRWEAPAPQFCPSDTNPDMKRGAIINDAHWSKFADIEGWNYDQANLVSHPDCGKGIVKKRYMVVWKLLHQRLLCFPVTSHNSEGIKDLAPDDQWFHVPLKFASNVGTNILKNLSPWPELRYTMFGQEGQLNVHSHIAVSDLYCLKIGNDIPTVLGALTADSVGDLEGIFNTAHSVRTTQEEGA